MNKRNGLLFGALAAGMIAGNASALVLAEYNFTGGSLASSDTEVSTTASDASFQAWLDNSAYPGGSSPLIQSDEFLAQTSVTNPSAVTGSALLSDAIAADNLIEFTITGTNFDVTSVSFDYRISGASTYKYHAFVLSDATGAVSQGSSGEIESTAATVPVSASANVASDWQGLNTLTVQIYLADSTTNSNGLHFIDNIVVEGTPEPGSLALLALGGIFVSWRRRRA